MYKLICGQDPVSLGISDAQGNLKMNAFWEHIKVCKECQQFADIIKRSFLSDIGSKGGKKSRRLLTSEQAREMVRKRKKKYGPHGPA